MENKFKLKKEKESLKVKIDFIDYLILRFDSTLFWLIEGL